MGIKSFIVISFLFKGPICVPSCYRSFVLAGVFEVDIPASWIHTLCLLPPL